MTKTVGNKNWNFFIFEYSLFCCQYKPKVKSEFAAYKVGVSRKQSLSLVYGKSEARKWPKKRQLMAARGVGK